MLDNVETDTKIPLQYLTRTNADAIVIPSRGGGDSTVYAGNYEMRSVLMRNGRESDFSLDREGFELHHQSTSVSDFYNDGEITSCYEDEVKALVLAATDARRVEIFDHTRRAASIETQQEKGIREPASTIHNDYTAESGPTRLRDCYPDEADELLQRRLAIINVWRSISGTIMNYPLAMCDASSVSPGELVSVERVTDDRVGEIQMAVYADSHRWFYFPRMQMDEALLFKVYDSATDGRARFTPHSSFDDPAACNDATDRQSIETRCFVFF
jgi:hypothetical protein